MHSLYTAYTSEPQYYVLIISHLSPVSVTVWSNDSATTVLACAISAHFLEIISVLYIPGISKSKKNQISGKVDVFSVWMI